MPVWEHNNFFIVYKGQLFAVGSCVLLQSQPKMFLGSQPPQKFVQICRNLFYITENNFNSMRI